MSEINKVRDNLNTWMNSFNNKDIDSLFSLYDPESIYANAGAPLMHGIAQIKPWYEQATAVMQGSLLFKEEYAFQEGNMALLIGKYYFKPPTDAQPDEVGGTGRVALVYRKAEDGRWLLLFDMDNTPPDISPADFE